MIRVMGNDIEVTRGDSIYLDVPMTAADGSVYVMEGSDQLVFTLRGEIKKDTEDEAPLLQKECGKLPICIAPAETAKLPYGSYLYDIELRMKGGDIFTVVEPHYFTLTAEVG